VRTALMGAGLGFTAALALSRVLAAMVWGVGPRDPLTYAAVAAGLLLVAGLAAFAPAAQAARADPVESLQAE